MYQLAVCCVWDPNLHNNIVWLWNLSFCFINWPIWWILRQRYAPFFSRSPKRQGLLQNVIVRTSDKDCGEKEETQPDKMGGEVWKSMASVMAGVTDIRFTIISVYNFRYSTLEASQTLLLLLRLFSRWQMMQIINQTAAVPKCSWTTLQLLSSLSA